MEWKPDFQENLLKELPETYEAILKPEHTAQLAENSLYGAWWQYLKASEKYPPRGPEGNPGTPTAELYAIFGQLTPTFKEWWILRGEKIFQEKKMVPHIQILGYDRDLKAGEKPAYIDIRIPLILSKEALIYQFKKLLKQVFKQFTIPTSPLRHSYSSSTLKIYPKGRYHREHYIKILGVWELKRRRPDMDWWTIGEYLNLSPILNVKPNDTDIEIREKHRDLGTHTRNMWHQADEIMTNALKGQFPCDDQYQDGRGR
jgi:hypothetical protein